MSNSFTPIADYDEITGEALGDAWSSLIIVKDALGQRRIVPTGGQTYELYSYCHQTNALSVWVCTLAGK